MKRLIKMVIVTGAALIVGAFLVHMRSWRDDGITPAVSPVFPSSLSPVIPLGISVAEAQNLPRGIALRESNIEIRGPRGERVNDAVEVNLAPRDNGEYGLVVNRKDAHAFKPGKYHIAADLETGQGIRRIEQDFLWGVLAMNPHQSVYQPGETARLSLAVLDERGMMVCDAEVTLTIREPERRRVTTLSTKDGSIRVNEECRHKRVTQHPDYETEYRVSGPGVYQMTLTAVTKNGASTIEDYFEVHESPPFHIERITATRIYPVYEYPVTIRVTPEEDFHGTVTEAVPEFFRIDVESDHPQVESRAKTKTLTWQVDWRAGETYELSYTYRAPQMSPQFYLLGPLKIEGYRGKRGERVEFEESRQWQMAVDAIAYVQSRSTSGSNITSLPLAFSSNNTSGNLIVVSSVWNSSSVTASVSDSAGNTYATAVGKTTNGELSVQTWYAMNVLSGANTITVSYSGMVNGQIMIHEYSGIVASGALDKTSFNTGTSTTCDSGSAVTIQADELIYGVCALLNTSTITKGSTYTQRETPTTRSMTEDKVVSSTGSYSADFSIAASIAWVAQMATFKAASGSNTPSITSVTDTPDPTNPYRSVTFITDWNDADPGENVKVKVCKTNSLTNQNCDGGYWASSTAFTTSDPESLVYDIVSGDWGQTRNYYVFVCDDEGNCSSSYSGTFAVRNTSDVPNVKFR